MVEPSEPNWSKNEECMLLNNLNKLVLLGAVGTVESCRGQYLSNIFLVPKPDGSQRLILNLKSLNKFLQTQHFKLEDHKTVSSILQSNAFMATLDLKDAYFLIPILENHRKYLRFRFKGKLYQYNCMPFGLNCAPLIFTKLMKPVLAFLRKNNLISVLYLDDFLLLGATYTDCKNNVLYTVKLLENLGFLINYKKSVLEPAQICRYLGFLYNSKDLSISIPDDKKLPLIKLIRSIINTEKCQIRHFARFVGKLVSVCPAVRYGWVYTKLFERQKYLALKRASGDYNKVMKICPSLLQDLKWWLIKIPQASNILRTYSFQIEIFSDSSLTGWGICCQNMKSHGFWSTTEKEQHINFLELQAAFFGLKCFAKDLYGCNVLLRIDNTTAIAYINRMGGVQYPNLNSLSRNIWQWCEKRNLFIHASYISSKDNLDADTESRQLRFETEWELNDSYFNNIVANFGVPEIDLFASRINTKCTKFISWRKDPDAFGVDAFTIEWKKLKFYAFPPFSIISQVLQKIINEQAQGIVVVPYWPAQPWYPIYTSLLIRTPIFFKPSINLLLSCDRSIPHPLWPKLTLVAGLLSNRRFN